MRRQMCTVAALFLQASEAGRHLICDPHYSSGQVVLLIVSFGVVLQIAEAEANARIPLADVRQRSRKSGV
jgi:hypothetical protein